MNVLERSIEKILSYLGNIYYHCYWEQGAYWFSPIEEKLRKVFVFPEFAEPKNIELAKIIKESNSISVHIRRYDSLYANKVLFESDYYSKCIRYLKEQVESPVFFVFSFSIEWCKKNLRALGFDNDDKIYFIDWNIDIDLKCKKAFRGMQLMSLCKYNIIANSTFSFWGGWLNDHIDKIVCAPRECYAKGFVNMMR